ncbi:MAG: S-methyl-5'-thioinosine phosphorylase [Gammaproteobacteria bacterium]|nr:S-methyl-5'-thioinosine phosphorylase [Gammaproteobacteria bacterium]
MGLIVGSGAAKLGLSIDSRSPAKTPYGEPSSPVLRTSIGGRSVLAIARHGESQNIPPHLVNYRANTWVLREHGVSQCIALNMVGIITAGTFEPGGLAVPDQIIDYTWGREHTFDDGSSGELAHIEFTEPFDPILRSRLAAVAAERVAAEGRGVYGVTQGPRLETAAEIERMARDGCTMVGMTAMPEAALARELGLAYAICAVGVNHAAGRGPGGRGIHEQLERFVADGMDKALAVLEHLIPDL